MGSNTDLIYRPTQHRNENSAQLRSNDTNRRLSHTCEHTQFGRSLAIARVGAVTTGAGSPLVLFNAPTLHCVVCAFVMRTADAPQLYANATLMFYAHGDTAQWTFGRTMEIRVAGLIFPPQSC